MPADQRITHDTGVRYTEMNTILARIRRRRSGEPTPKERARLVELKAEIKQIRAGEYT